MTAARLLGLLLLCLAAGPRTGVAQVEVRLGAGARVTSTLVNDQILTPISVTAGLAPAITLTVLDRPRAGSRWAPDVAFDLSRSNVRVTDGGTGTTQTLTSLTTVAFTVGVRRTLPAGLEGRAGLGALQYLPGDKIGIFKDGVGIAALASIAFDYAPATFAHGRVGVSLRYDVHRFNTTALRSVGFADPRTVHRVAILVHARVLNRGGGAP